MSSHDPAALVCPSCRSEYIAGITMCSDCLVALVERSELREVDHDVITYDLTDWPGDKFERLRWQLRQQQLPHAFEGRALTASREVEAIVDGLIDDIDAEASEASLPNDVAVSGEGAETPFQEHRRGDIAGLGARFLGNVGDSVVWSVVATAILNVGVDHSRFDRADLRPRFLVAGVIGFLYEVVCVAVWGQTLGKRVARTRVVDAFTRQTPSWSASFARVAVTSVAVVAAVIPRPFGPVFGLATFAWSVALVLSIVLEREHRGYHDRMSGTVVIRT